MVVAQESRPQRDSEIIRLERTLPPGAPVAEGRVQILTTRRARLGIFFTMRARDTDSIGALVQGVTPNGPAAKAGLRSGDLITRFNGRSLVESGVRAGREQSGPGVALALLVAGVGPGDTVAVEYRRGKLRRNASIIAGDEPFITWNMPGGAFGYAFGDSDGDIAEAMRHPPESWGGPFQYRIPADSLRVMADSARGFMRMRVPPPTIFMLGTPLGDLELVPLNRDLGRYFGVSEGVLVISVPEDSKLGLKAGDVVLAVDGRTPANPTHLLRILRSYEPGEPFKFEIMRMKKHVSVTGMVAER
jgi:S1-C subfamily serine protease